MMVPAMFLGFATVGCNESSEPTPATSTVAKQDPAAEFEWGVTRLRRALRLFRPSSSNGINITEQTVDTKLTSPDETTPNYTAAITVTTETSFLHGRRSAPTAAAKKGSAEELSALEDPIADDFDSADLLAQSGIGAKGPSGITPRLETRNFENKTVFDMIYVSGKWQLTKQPELKHEQLWFEYAFEN